ncbi:hypothetical protein [Phnomibacter sp. MR]|uniref:hypothetical protein n=1 Tax=Phnomibacter sp. MR TaxID=3042318 RepID=UPI003A7FFC9F
MKKFLLMLTLVSVIVSQSMAAFVEKDAPSKMTIQKEQLIRLATMTEAEFEQASGQQLTGMGRFAFKMAQKRIKHNMNADGTFKKRFEKRLNRYYGDEGFHIGGFALGFFFGIIGVAVAYLITNGDDITSRTKWAWWGLATSALLSIAFYIIIYSSM